MAQEPSDPARTTARESFKSLLAQLPIYSTMSEPLRPQYFITRQNGTMVPLVALDELPATISIRGVPRTLSPYDVAGMTCLGTVESKHLQYVVDGVKQGFRPEAKAPENGFLEFKHGNVTTNNDLGSSFNGFRLRNGAENSTLNPPKPKAFGIEETRSAVPSNLRTIAEGPAESTNRSLTIEDLARNPAPGVKEYCSYWLRHGECDYAQQGCLYRHEMPLDPPTLEKLGLRDIPRWYREKHRLGSYLALGAQRAARGSTRSGFMDRNWRDNADFAPPSAGTKPPANSQTKDDATSTHNAVSSWNAFANKQSHIDAYNSNIRGPLHSASPPPTAVGTACIGRQAFPPLPYPNPTTPRQLSTAPRPGTRLVPVNTESLSARVLREANEQLDACEEAERAALSKFTPLIPIKTGSGTVTITSSSDESPIDLTPPTSASERDESGSGGEMMAESELKQAHAILKTPKAAIAAPAPSTAPAPPTAPAASACGSPKKKNAGAGGRTRATRKATAGVDGSGVDREAQRKAVAKTRVQAEGLGKAKAKVARK